MLAKGKDASYKSTMLRSFFEKLEQRGLFDNFVNHMIHICNSDCAINEVELLLSYALDYVINEAYDRSLFIDVWYESMNELEPNNKRIFLYETKLNIEQKIRSNILGYSKEYEKKWYTEA